MFQCARPLRRSRARFPLLSPTVTSSPGAGEVFPQRESQAVKFIAKVLDSMRKFPVALLPLPLGEVDLRSKDGEGAPSRNFPSHLALLDANPCGHPFRLAASRQATFPKGTASAVTGSFTAQPKGVPLGELAATKGSRLRVYFDDATATPSGEVASRNDDGEGSSLSGGVLLLHLS